MTNTETDVEVVQHWGCQFVRPDGTVYITRWNPSYGGGIYEPYTEEEARHDVANKELNWTKRLVTRTETVTTVTTDWEVVE